MSHGWRREGHPAEIATVHQKSPALLVGTSERSLHNGVHELERLTFVGQQRSGRGRTN